MIKVKIHRKIINPNSSYSNNVPLDVSVVDANVDSVWYEIVVRQSGNSQLVNTSFVNNISLTSLSADNFRIFVYANDSRNNIGVVTVDFKVVSSTTGTGSGGSGGTPFREVVDDVVSSLADLITIPKFKLPVFDIDFSKNRKILKFADEGDVFSLSLNGLVPHSLTVKEKKLLSVVFEVASDPILIEIMEGDSASIDINNDGLNDFNILLVSILPDTIEFQVERNLKNMLIAAKEEIIVKKSKFFENYAAFVIGIIVLLFVALGYDFSRKKVRFLGLFMVSVFSMFLLVNDWLDV